MKTRLPFQRATRRAENIALPSGENESPSYTIVMLNDTAIYSKGMVKKIIAPKAIFGRDPGSTVAFSQDDETVSLKHAAIERDNQHYFLIHLSYSNPTLLNGKPINEVGFKTILQNGDVIQLSRIGPRFEFSILAPQRTNNLTQRFHAFVKKSLRPYQVAIITLIAILVVALGLLAYQYFKYEPLLTLSQTIQQQHTEDAQKIIELNRQNEDMQNLLKKEFLFNKTVSIPAGSRLAKRSEGNISQLNSSIYMIRAKTIDLTYSDGSVQHIDLTPAQAWTGTGFLCTDGRFITARHVIEPWMFFGKSDSDMIKLNLISTQGGKVTVSFEAQSSNRLTFRFTNQAFAINQATDCNTIGTTASGESVALIKAIPQEDWAVMRTAYKSGVLTLAPQLSCQLSQAETLHVLGYPSGEMFQDKNRLEPLYSTTTVAQSGIKNGFINVSNRTFDTGNSGGPVFVQKENKFWVVGIVASKIGEIGRIIPIIVLP